MLFGAGSCVDQVVEDAKIESPTALQVQRQGDVVPLSATESEKRRRWESNPRWRICNPLP